MSFLLSNRDVHTVIVGVEPGSVRQKKGTWMTRAYCVAVRTSLIWPFWSPLWELLIEDGFAVRIQCMSWMDT